jgi:hypothetical protein
VLRQFYARGNWRNSPPRRSPIQVILSPSSLKNLSRGTPSGMHVYIRIREPGRFQTTLDRIRRLDHTGGAALPVAHEKRRDLRLCCELFGLAFPSRVRDVCGPRGTTYATPIILNREKSCTLGILGTLAQSIPKDSRYLKWLKSSASLGVLLQWLAG